MNLNLPYMQIIFLKKQINIFCFLLYPFECLIPLCCSFFFEFLRTFGQVLYLRVEIHRVHFSVYLLLSSEFRQRHFLENLVLCYSVWVSVIITFYLGYLGWSQVEGVVAEVRIGFILFTFAAAFRFGDFVLT